MNTVFFRGFIPNSNKRVFDLIDINSDNPFTILAESRNYPDIITSLFYAKVLPCEKHRVFGLLYQIDLYQNVWRILEVLHELVPKKYGKLPLSWYYMIDYLGDKSFHRHIKNISSGEKKIYQLCYAALEHLLDFMVNQIDGKFKMIEDQITWEDISFLLVKIINLLSTSICSCHQLTIYDNQLLDRIKIRYSMVVRSQLNDLINQIPVWTSTDYRDIEIKNYFKRLEDLFLNPPEKAFRRRAKSITLPYDLLNETKRINYIHRKINHIGDYYFNGDSIVSNYYMLGLEEALPIVYHVKSSVNQCYVCDRNVLEPYHPVKIMNGVITELPSTTIQLEYPIIHRCGYCKKGKYELLADNDKIVLARHYKWMTFLSGFYDLNSELSNIPFDVAKIIILMYQYVR